LTILIIEQFQSLSEDDRGTLVLCIFFALVGSEFFIAQIMMNKPQNRTK
jgi:hypothetical protein